MGTLLDALPDSFIKKVLTDINPEIAENLLVYQKKYRDCTDKEEKVVLKERLSTSFWNVYLEVGKQISPNMPSQKRLFLRYGLLDMKYLTEEDQKMVLSMKIDETDAENSVYYADEWLLAVSQGKIKPSVTDEQPKRKKESGGGSDDSGAKAKYERLSGASDAEKMNYQTLLERRKQLEDQVLMTVNMVMNHSTEPILELPDTYTEDALKRLDEVLDIVRELRSVDKQLTTAKNSYATKFEELREIEKQIAPASGDMENMTYEVDTQTVESEVGAIRQMTKMTVGRQGNHFPIMASGFLPKETRDYNFKAAALKKLLEIEQFDSSVFLRPYRNNVNRILPYIILMPGYGNFGICWEPYDKYNKATSKGRVAIPIFTRTPFYVISMAMADFRWQTAKELASFHWMDEGLTGLYYQYFMDNKLKGDIKTTFVEDYILWLTKESGGVQKLHKDARYVFWRYVPFPDKLKEELSLKGYYYSELWKKEQTFRAGQGKM